MRRHWSSNQRRKPDISYVIKIVMFAPGGWAWKVTLPGQPMRRHFAV
jgi:hypothetical protein